MSQHTLAPRHNLLLGVLSYRDSTTGEAHAGRQGHRCSLRWKELEIGNRRPIHGRCCRASGRKRLPESLGGSPAVERRPIAPRRGAGSGAMIGGGPATGPGPGRMPGRWPPPTTNRPEFRPAWSRPAGRGRRPERLRQQRRSPQCRLHAAGARACPRGLRPSRLVSRPRRRTGPANAPAPEKHQIPAPARTARNTVQ